MKLKIQLLIILITFCTYNTYGQITTEIIDILVNNQTTVSNCSLIDLEDNYNVSLTIYFKLTKPSNQALGTTNVKALLRYSSSSSGDEKGTYSVQSNSWVNNNTEFYGQIPISVSENEIQVNGSSIFIKSITDSGSESNSCGYSIIKDQLPEFEIQPASVSISCGSTSHRVFTVNNFYNSPGTLSYNWNVGTGWKRNGFAVNGIITTTTNSITLVPNSTTVLPSNVSVTTSLDGVSYGTETATVNRGGYNPITQISGSNQLCDNATYTVVNLLQGSTLSGWTSSNTNIATITTNTNNEGVLTAVGNGIVRVSATVTNACGQTAIITSDYISVGAPTVNNYGINGGSSSVYVNDVSYFSVSPVSGNNINYYWWITPASSCSAGSGPTINNVNPYTSSSTSAQVNWGASICLFLTLLL